jgi:hypothetical protein
MPALNALAAVLAAFLLVSAAAVASPSPGRATPGAEVTSTDHDGRALSGRPARDGGSRDDEDFAPPQPAPQ